MGPNTMYEDGGRRFRGIRRWWARRSGTWWWATLVIVVPVGVVTAAAVAILLTFVDVGMDPKDRIEVIKTGLTVGAGTGGVVALVLTGRRQWATEHDNTERRLTELYLKAVEQLGSDKAAVRHGGLYALERVAQTNPDQRQTIVDVICAYLRAPYVAPGETPVRRLGVRRPLLTSTQTRAAVARVAPGSTPKAPTRHDIDGEARQEREVRLTAQQLLARHLRPGDQDRPAATFWADIDLDLTGSTLIDFHLSGCAVREASFDEVIFTGPAWFQGTTFTGRVKFGAATFTKPALFDRATFTNAAVFAKSSFTSNAWFEGATFAGNAWFQRVTFIGFARFGGATFAGPTADFTNVRFEQGVPLEVQRFVSKVPVEGPTPR